MPKRPIYGIIANAFIGAILVATGIYGIYSVGYAKGSEHLEIKTKISENYRGMEESTDELIVTINRFQDLYYCGPEEPDGQ